MHDAVAFEEQGVPTAVIVTTEFLHESHVQRAALGMDERDPVVIQHPLSTLSEDEIAGRIEQAVEQAKALLLGRSAEA